MLPSADRSADSPRVTWPLVVVGLAVVLGIASRFAECRRLDHDVFHALSLWRETVRQGSVPRGDLWAYTETLPVVVHHEWLTGGLNHWLVIGTGWGPSALLAWKVACVVLAGWCCWRIARLRGALPITFCCLLPLVLGFGMLGLGIGRAQVTTFLLFAVLLYFLELDRHGKRFWIAVWIPLFILWLNLHGGVAAGCGALAIMTVERTARHWSDSGRLSTAIHQTKHLWITGAAMLPLLGLNPYRWNYVIYLVESLTMDRSNIREWQSLIAQPNALALSIFAGMVLASVYAVKQLGWRKTDGIVLLLVLTLLGFRQMRQLSLMSIVWLAYVPGWLEKCSLGASLRRLWHERPQSVGIVMGAWGLVMTIRLVTLGAPWALQIPIQGPIYYPTGLADYLEEHEFSGNLTTTFETGAWISWRLYPRVKVSFDSRYEAAYPPSVFDDTLTFYDGGPGWQESFARLAGDAVMVPRCQRVYPKIQAAQLHDWVTVYQDDAQILMVRRPLADQFPIVDRRGTKHSRDVLRQLVAITH